MSEINPMLLLVIGLLALGLLISGALAVYVTKRLCRRNSRPARPWQLLAVVCMLTGAGTVLLGTGYLARTSRRNVAGWLLAQAAAMGACGYLVSLAMPSIRLVPVLTLLGGLLGVLVVAALPLLTLALLGPRLVDKPSDLSGPLVVAKGLRKTYMLGRRELPVLRDVSLSIPRGQFVAILGASGSGKSTLLHLLGLLDAPDKGHLTFDGLDMAAVSPAQRDHLRNMDIGFVFQFYHLLPELSVLENVLLPVMAAGGVRSYFHGRKAARARAIALLDRVGLADRLDSRPRQLSGGEQQRVAIARALIHQPRLLLADEPTGNLDSQTGLGIIKLLKQLNEENGQSIVMVTHDLTLAQMASTILHLRDGKLA
jgi:lipoprotein-releasing system ATP-binding protein